MNATYSPGATATVYVMGVVSGLSGLRPGATYYLAAGNTFTLLPSRLGNAINDVMSGYVALSETTAIIIRLNGVYGS